jgi:hypothetical protein
VLDLESRQEILGITVFRDADDPSLFYYLPANPHISRDAGGPMFDLFAYRKGGEAGQTYSGGFLTMTVDVGLGDLYDRIKGKLSAAGGDGGEVKLTSVPYSSGTVRVIALDADTGGGGAGGTPGAPKFVQTVLGSGKPSLDGDNRAIFSLSLTEEGSAFFLAVLEGRANARPVGVVYDLQYVGLLPAYSLDIKIDMKSSYEFMESRFSVNTLFFKADIDNVTEQLKKNQSIVIKETARTLELSSAEGMAGRQQRINDLVSSLCSGVLFQQTLVPGQPAVQGQLMSVAGNPSGTPTGTTSTPTGTTTTTPTGTTTTTPRPTGTTTTTPTGTTTTTTPTTTTTTGTTGTTGTTTSPPISSTTGTGRPPPPPPEEDLPSARANRPAGGDQPAISRPLGAQRPAADPDRPVMPPPEDRQPTNPPTGTTTPPTGTTTPPTGTTTPPTGTTTPPTGTTTPPTGTTTPPTGTTTPPTGTTTPPTGTTTPPTGTTTPPGTPVTTTSPAGTTSTPVVSAPVTSGGTTTTRPATTTTTTGTAQPPPPATGTSGSSDVKSLQDIWDKLGRPQVAYAMKSISQEERRTISYQLDQVTAQQQSVAPQSFIQFMASPEELKQRVHVIDLNHPFYERIKIRVDAADVDFAAQGVSQMTVEIRYGTRPDGTSPKDTASAILRSKDDFKEYEFFTDSNRTLSYEYRLIIDYQHDFGVGVRETHVEGPWTTSELRTLSVQPGWLGLMVPATLQLAPNTPDDVKELQVQVRYQNAAAGVDDGELVSLSPTARSQVVPLRLAAAGDQVAFTPTVFYADGASETLAPLFLPNAQATDALVFGVPQAGRVNGDVVLVDALGELTKVIVDLEVSQAGKVVESKSLELAGAGARQTWSVRLPERDKPGSVRWRQRLAYSSGGLETAEWRESDTSNLVAGIPTEGVLNVTVRYVGAVPSSVGLAGVVVKLSYTDPGGDATFNQTESLFVDDTPASRLQEWKVRLKDKTARTYSYSVTALKADGTEVTSPVVQETTDEIYVHVPGMAAPAQPEPPGPPPIVTPAPANPVAQPTPVQPEPVQPQPEPLP